MGGDQHNCFCGPARRISSTEDVCVITSTKERRAFQRMIINAPVTIFQQQQVLEGVCRDLSANGMGISVPEHQLDTTQPIRVSLATNNNLLPPFEAQARIIRVLEEEDGLLLAIEFQSLA
ncbi:PilZ domain-containing protein [Aeromonas dhakensis]|nr:PilZ domain-containing protein [Aeromonas dhakensis]